MSSKNREGTFLDAFAGRTGKPEKLHSASSMVFLYFLSKFHFISQDLIFINTTRDTAKNYLKNCTTSKHMSKP